MYILLSLLAGILVLVECDGFEHSSVFNGELEKKLLLTPYIKAGKIEEARNMSRVIGIGDLTSYSGFLTVRKEYNSNLFFWYFPAEYDYKKAPLLLWLQGGPGASSLEGLFTELGPFRVTENLTLIQNPYSWHKNHSLLFIDNPVGSGFSFTEDERGYSSSMERIRKELYIAIIQFLKLFPELQSLQFFICGESYAGKYIPHLGYVIHNRNPTAKIKINLQGLAVGNGFTDPQSLMAFHHFGYHLGLIDNKLKKMLDHLEKKCRTLGEKKKNLRANECWRLYRRSFLNNGTSWRINLWNFLQERMQNELYDTYLDQPTVRKALHVGDTPFDRINFSILHRMRGSMINSALQFLEHLLEYYRVLYYSGQLDVLVPYSLSINMYSKMNFTAAEEYRNATRVPWYVDGELAGFMKSGGNFTEVLVRNAGHMVPKSQPKWALDLINRFTRDKLQGN